MKEFEKLSVVLVMREEHGCRGWDSVGRSGHVDWVG